MTILDHNRNDVWVFKSSTFTDTASERDTLWDDVHPFLRIFCQRLGVGYNVVDMRWGIRDEATDHHQTTAICMSELKRCQEQSLGPNFVCLLSARAGYFPFPVEIPDEIFQDILNQARIKGVSPDDIALIQEWFRVDENQTPPTYILQPISSKFSLEFGIPGDWWKIFDRLQLALRAASFGLANREFGELFRRAITEEEVRRGILTAPDVKERSFFFDRTLTDVDLTDPAVNLFVDLERDESGKMQPFRSQLLQLQRLKGQVHDKLPKENVFRYTTPWGMGGINPEHHPDQIRAFSDKYASHMMTSIVEAVKRTRQAVDIEYLEAQHHNRFCVDRANIFVGRADILSVVERHLRQTTSAAQPTLEPLVLWGFSGCGKTSLMAVAAHNVFKRQSPSPTGAVVILRFLGTSLASSSAQGLLRNLCMHLVRVYAPPDLSPDAVPEDLKDLVALFPRLLATLPSASRPLYLFLDSLDQLGNRDHDRELKWLPMAMPPHVWMVLSTLPNEGPCYEVLRRRLSPSSFQEVPQLSSADGEGILKQWLDSAGRRLTQKQQRIVLTTFEKSPSPLFLRLCYDMAVKWRSYFPDTETQLRETVQKLINFMFERLEHLHGQVFVSRALGYLTAAKGGLSVSELEDVLSCDDAVLDSVFVYWTPPVRRLPPLLWVRLRNDLDRYVVERGSDGTTVFFWYHRQFWEVAEERYLQPKDRKERHAQLASLFAGDFEKGVEYTSSSGVTRVINRRVTPQPLVISAVGGKRQFNARKLAELPYHLTGAEQWDKLVATLCTLEFIEAKCASGMIFELIEDYNRALANKSLTDPGLRAALTEYGAFVAANVRVLSNFPELVYQQALNERLGSPIVAAAENVLESVLAQQSVLRLVNVPRVRNLCILVLAGHDGPINNVVYSSDGSLVASASADRTLRVYDSSSGVEVAAVTLCRGAPIPSVDPVSQGVSCARFLPQSKSVMAGSVDGHLRVVDTLTGTETTSLDLGARINSLDISRDGLIAVGLDCGFVSFCALNAATAKEGNTQYVELARCSLSSTHVKSVRFTADGRKLAVASLFVGISGQETVSAYSIPENAVALSSKKFQESLSKVHHYQGTITASGASWDNTNSKLAVTINFRVLVFDLAESGRQPTALRHACVVTGVEFSPDSKHLIVAGTDKCVHLWHYQDHMKAWSPMHKLRGHSDAVFSVAVSLPRSARENPASEDNSFLLCSASADRVLRVWDMSLLALQLGGAEAATVAQSELTSEADPDADREYFQTFGVSGFRGYKLRLPGQHGRHSYFCIPDRMDDRFDAMHAPDGRHCINCRLRATWRCASEHPQALKAWTASTDVALASNQPNLMIGSEAMQHPERVYCLAFSNDGRSVATGCAGGLVYLWSLITDPSTRRGHFSPLDASISCVRFSSCDTYLAAATSGHQLAVFNAQKLVRLVILKLDSPATSIDFSYLPFEEPPAEDAPAKPTATVLPAYKLVASCLDHSLRLWDSLDLVPNPPKGRHTRSDGLSSLAENRSKLLRGHRDVVSWCCFLHGNEYIVSSSADKTIRVWNVASTECISVFFSQGDARGGTALGPNLFACADGSNEVYLIDLLQRGKRLADIPRREQAAEPFDTKKVAKIDKQTYASSATKLDGERKQLTEQLLSEEIGFSEAFDSLHLSPIHYAAAESDIEMLNRLSKLPDFSVDLSAKASLDEALSDLRANGLICRWEKNRWRLYGKRSKRCVAKLKPGELKEEAEPTGDIRRVMAAFWDLPSLDFQTFGEQVSWTGPSPLETALISKQVASVVWLLDHGAQPPPQKNAIRLLMSLKLQLPEETIKLLVRNVPKDDKDAEEPGSDDDPQERRSRDDHEDDPDYDAAASEEERLERETPPSGRMPPSKVLPVGFSVGIGDEDRILALARAGVDKNELLLAVALTYESSDPSLAVSLVKMGASWTEKVRSSTPLQQALSRAHLPMIEAALSANVVLTMTDLICAVQASHWEIGLTLLKKLDPEQLARLDIFIDSWCHSSIGKKFKENPETVQQFFDLWLERRPNPQIRVSAIVFLSSKARVSALSIILSAKKSTLEGKEIDICVEAASNDPLFAGALVRSPLTTNDILAKLLVAAMAAGNLEACAEISVAIDKVNLRVAKSKDQPGQQTRPPRSRPPPPPQRAPSRRGQRKKKYYDDDDNGDDDDNDDGPVLFDNAQKATEIVLPTVSSYEFPHRRQLGIPPTAPTPQRMMLFQNIAQVVEDKRHTSTGFTDEDLIEGLALEGDLADIAEQHELRSTLLPAAEFDGLNAFQRLCTRVPFQAFRSFFARPVLTFSQFVSGVELRTSKISAEERAAIRAVAKRLVVPEALFATAFGPKVAEKHPKRVVLVMTIAIVERNLRAVTAIRRLQLGVFLNQQARTSRESWLAVACFAGKSNVVRALLKSGAQPNDVIETPPLHMAIRGGHLHIVKILVEEGKANVDIRGLAKTGKYSDITVFYHAIHICQNRKEIEIAKYLASKKADLNAADFIGKTALAYALEALDFDFATALLDSGADVTSAINQPGPSSDQNAMRDLEPLLNFELRTQPTPVDQNRWLKLSGREIYSGLQILMLHAPPRLSSIPSFDLKVSSKVEALALRLVDMHPGDIPVKGPQHDSVLLLCCLKGYMQPVLKILRRLSPQQKETARLVSVEASKMTVAHFAAKYGSLDVLRELLGSAAATAINAQDKEGQTPLHHAAIHSQVETIRVLCGEFKAQASVRNEAERNPLHEAVLSKSAESVEALLKFCSKSDINCAESSGATPLLYAARIGAAEIVRLLLDAGADLKASTESVIVRACSCTNEKAALLLLDRFPSLLSQKTENEETLLHIAARAGNSLLVDKLISLGLKMTDRDCFKNNCFNAARANGKLRILLMPSVLAQMKIARDFESPYAEEVDAAIKRKKSKKKRDPDDYSDDDGGIEFGNPEASYLFAWQEMLVTQGAEFMKRLVSFSPLMQTHHVRNLYNLMQTAQTESFSLVFMSAVSRAPTDAPLPFPPELLTAALRHAIPRSTILSLILINEMKAQGTKEDLILAIKHRNDQVAAAVLHRGLYHERDIAKDYWTNEILAPACEAGMTETVGILLNSKKVPEKPHHEELPFLPGQQAAASNLHLWVHYPQLTTATVLNQSHQKVPAKDFVTKQLPEWKASFAHSKLELPPRTQWVPWGVRFALAGCDKGALPSQTETEAMGEWKEEVMQTALMPPAQIIPLAVPPVSLADFEHPVWVREEDNETFKPETDVEVKESQWTKDWLAKRPADKMTTKSQWPSADKIVIVTGTRKNRVVKPLEL
eukprot:TRINITY_DN459_c0_g1_i2.p1 TRINITY_DN459_c0_g1~~TRINITY_DN459_c0_g1_i2.p1  ORF type:complete len:3633 (-),score=762.01 TRINITY_DN459_c0_g1_i2:106-9975(-)